MAMRDYISINNYSGRGKIGISRGAIGAIAIAALKEVPGATVYLPTPKPVKSKKAKKPDAVDPSEAAKVVFSKDGKAVVKMEVSLARGVNVQNAAIQIQETVAMAVKMMCDTVPFDVQVKVMRIV